MDRRKKEKDAMKKVEKKKGESFYEANPKSTNR